MADVGLPAVTGLLHLALVVGLLAPLVWWRARRGGYPALKPGGARWLLAGAGIYVVAHFVLSLPRVGFFAELAWNWQNKLLLLGLMVLAVSLSPTMTWHDIGLRQPRQGWWVAVLAVFVGTLGVNLVGGPEIATDTETFLFQALVPGLDEELLFRGILLLSVSWALTARRSMWHGEVGWEVPVTCLLFGLVHGLSVSAGWALQIDVPEIMLTGLIGLLLVWFRVRWDSLWPAVLAHNAINSAVVLANALAGS